MYDIFDHLHQSTLIKFAVYFIDLVRNLWCFDLLFSYAVLSYQE